MIDQLNRIEVEIPSSRGADPTPTEATPPEEIQTQPDPSEPTRPASEFRGAPSPYLEERLDRARRYLLGLSRDVREVAARSQTLESALESIERELARASAEVAFVRSRGDDPDPPRDAPERAEVSPLPRPSPSVGASVPILVPPGHVRFAAVARSEAGPPDDNRFGSFTVARYNRTMGDLQRRRRTVARLVLVAAATISFALVTLAVLTHEPQPPLWLAVLPVIWMVPVPFFVLSFRGTHRVLRRTDFDLPEAP